MNIKNIVLICFIMVGGLCHGRWCKCYIKSAGTGVSCTQDSACAGICSAYTHRCSSIKLAGTASRLLDKDVTSKNGWCGDKGTCQCPWGQVIRHCGRNNQGVLTCEDHNLCSFFYKHIRGNA
jgi:hypothetical protein